MAQLAHIGVAIDEDLLAKFDMLIVRRGYTNLSVILVRGKASVV